MSANQREILLTKMTDKALDTTYKISTSFLKLNFNTYQFAVKKKLGKLHIFDEIRKKYVSLTKEEWVRQHTIKYLLNEKKISPSFLGIEKQISIKKKKKRCDILVYNSESNSVKLIVECKAPNIVINQTTFDQISIYNYKLYVKWLMITNGLQHFYFQVDFENKKFISKKDLPNYANL